MAKQTTRHEQPFFRQNYSFLNICANSSLSVQAFDEEKFQFGNRKIRDIVAQNSRRSQIQEKEREEREGNNSQIEAAERRREIERLRGWNCLIIK